MDKISLGKPSLGASESGWHSTESLLRCEKEYQFQHVRGISKPQHETPDYFAVGLLFHAGRARWFSLNFATGEKAWAKVSDAIQAEAERQKLPVSMKAELYARNLMRQYADHWLTRPLPKPVAAEYTLGPTELVPGDPLSVRTARLDDASSYEESGGVLCVGESKTTSTSIQDTINQYTLHGQPVLQAILWGLSKQGAAKHGPISGVMLDVVKKGYGKEKAQFGRQFIAIPEYVKAWFTSEIVKVSHRADELKKGATASRNISMCTRLVGRQRMACPYRELCIHGRSATTGFAFADGSSLLTKKDSWK